jgi:tetratricopeptide (TPR) repeat protein
MKPIVLLLLLSTLTIIAPAQQKQIADDALLLDYYQNQRFTDALDYLKKIYPDTVNDIKILSKLAYTAQMAGKLVEAETCYQRIYDTDSTKSTVLFNLGAINLRRGNNEKAEIYYKKIAKKDTTNFMVYKQLAKICMLKGDVLNLIGYLLRANRINPAEPDVASDLSDVYVNLKEYAQAEKVLDKAIAEDPENAVLLQSELKLYYSQEKWEETKNTCLKLQQLGDQSGYVLTKLGIAYYNLKDYACCAETLAGISPMEQTETSYYVAALCNKELKDQNNAIVNFNNAINSALSPNVGNYYSEIASCYAQLKKYKKAIPAYQNSLKFDEKPLTFYMLAALYDVNLKNKKMAVSYYKKYVAAKTPAKEQKYKVYAASRINALKN